jgi:hypothetical protein
MGPQLPSNYKKLVLRKWCVKNQHALELHHARSEERCSDYVALRRKQFLLKSVLKECNLKSLILYAR